MYIYTKNIQGKTVLAFQQAHRLLDAAVFDLIVLFETWFGNFEAWRHDPYILAWSTVTPLPSVGHRPGGIAVLCRPDCSNQYTILNSTNHSITVKHSTGTTFTFSYYAPSLGGDDVQADFNCLPPSDLWIGDFNFRLGSANYDKTMTNQQRASLIHQLAARWNMTRLDLKPASQTNVTQVQSLVSQVKQCRLGSAPMSLAKQLQNYFNESVDPSTGNGGLSSRTDHAFIRQGSCGSGRVYPNKSFGLHSDHNDIIVSYQQVTQSYTPHNQQGTKLTQRMCIRKLDEESYVRTICNAYDTWTLGCNLSLMLQSAQRHTMSLGCNKASAQVILDLVYDTFETAIWQIGCATLGTYVVQHVHHEVDDLLDQLDVASTADEAIQLFKRSCRGNIPQMKPTNPDDDRRDAAMIEAFDLWKDVWSPLNVQEVPHDNVPFCVDRNRSFPPGMIESYIKSYPNSRAVGHDGIHTRVLKALLPCSFSVHVEAIFNLCLRLGLTPSSWNKALTVIIPKDVHDPVISKGRPITLIPILRRVYEKCLLDMWCRPQQLFSNLHQCQAGGRTGYSAPTHVLLADAMIKSGRDVAVLLDMKKGFDSIQHIDLLQYVMKRNCSPHVLSLIHSLFLNGTTTQLVVDQHLSDPITFKKGVLQGSPLSPLLFNLWIDQLALDLCPPDTEPRALFYIDDIILMAKTCEEMRSMLSVCERWAMKHKAQFNVAKCQSLAKPGMNEDFILIDERIPAVNEARYLGVPMTCAGADWMSLSRKQMDEAEGMLRWFHVIGSHWPQWIRLQLVQTFLLPKLDYFAAIRHGAALMNAELMATLTSMYKSFDEKVLSFVMRMSNVRARKTCMRMMTLIKPTTVRHKDLFVGFFRHIQSLHIRHPIQSMPSNEVQLRLLSMMRMPSAEYNEWKLEMNSRGRGTGVMQLSDWLKRRFMTSILETKDVLPLYILPCHRSAKPDPILYHRNNEERQWMVQWRLGTLFVRRKCRCGEPFRRSHVHQCFYPLYRPSTQDAEEAELRWKLEEAQVRRLAQLHGSDYKGHYTVLDSYLNNDKSHLFLSFVYFMRLEICLDDLSQV
jgi:hypothetical protein